MATGFTNPDTVIEMPKPPAIELAVNVSINTFNVSDGALSEAPDVAVNEGDASDGEPVKVIINLPVAGTATAGAKTIVILTAAPPARTSDNVIAGPVKLPSTIAGYVPAALCP